MSGTTGKVLCLGNNTFFKQAFSLLRFRTSGENPIYSAAEIKYGMLNTIEKEPIEILLKREVRDNSIIYPNISHLEKLKLSPRFCKEPNLKMPPCQGIPVDERLKQAFAALSLKRSNTTVFGPQQLPNLSYSPEHHPYIKEFHEKNIATPEACIRQPKKKKGKVEVRPINLGTDYEYGVLNIHMTAYDMTLAESYAQYVHNLCNHLSIKVEESFAMPTKTMEMLRLPDQGSKMFLDAVLTTHERVVQISGLSATFAEIFLEIIHSNLPEGVKLSVKEHTEEDFKGRFKARPELEELLAKLN